MTSGCACTTAVHAAICRCTDSKRACVRSSLVIGRSSRGASATVGGGIDPTVTAGSASPGRSSTSNSSASPLRGAWYSCFNRPTTRRRASYRARYRPELDALGPRFGCIGMRLARRRRSGVGKQLTPEHDGGKADARPVVGPFCEKRGVHRRGMPVRAGSWGDHGGGERWWGGGPTRSVIIGRRLISRKR